MFDMRSFAPQRLETSRSGAPFRDLWRVHPLFSDTELLSVRQRISLYPSIAQSLIAYAAKFLLASVAVAVIACGFSWLDGWESNLGAGGSAGLLRDLDVTTRLYSVVVGATSAWLLSYYIRSSDRLERSFLVRLLGIVVYSCRLSSRAERALRWMFLAGCCAACVVIYSLRPLRAWFSCVARSAGACGAQQAPGWGDVLWYSMVSGMLYGLFLLLLFNASYQYAILKRIGFLEGGSGAGGDERVGEIEPGGRPEEFSLRLAHLSDLHITKDEQTRRVEEATKERLGLRRPGARSGALGGNAAMARLVERHTGALAECDAVLVTGDITDAGTEQEWKAAATLFGDLWTSGRLILIPGNHDLNFPTSDKQLTVTESPGYVSRACRLVRMLSVMDEVQGERAFVLDRGERRTLREYLEHPGRRGVIEAFLEKPTSAGSARVHALWDAAFPMAVTVSGSRGDAAVCLIFDSIQRASYWITNAFGGVSPAALERARVLRHGYAHLPRLYALHHHVLLPRDRGGIQALGMVLANAREFVELLREEASTVVFHGHKHWSKEIQLGKSVTVLSATSSTLGDDADSAGATPNGRGPGFSLYYLGQDAEKRFAVLGREWLSAGDGPAAPPAAHPLPTAPPSRTASGSADATAARHASIEARSSSSDGPGGSSGGCTTTRTTPGAAA
ncbi:hypothetical protein BE20_44580 [Sorangium cellulosum]|nr:hypothetical protein BE20_44580 [Sorangium cellulosum]